MKQIALRTVSALALFLLSLALTTLRAEEGASNAGHPLDCKIGPVEKAYGGFKWLVYGCTDGKSVVFVAPPNSPAFPFYFSLTPDRLFGEGTGDTKATDAAYADIHSLSSDDLVELVRETQAVSSKK